MNVKATALVLFLTLLGAFAGYLGFELSVRRELWSWYAGNATPMMVINQSLDYWPAVDDFFHRKPGKSIGALKVNETFTVAYVVDGEAAFAARVRTNNLGFLSDKRYEVARPPGSNEFRIYFAGDSMTGSTTIGRQWVDLLEDVLNSNPQLVAAAGGKTFRTYNAGVPGANFRYFWDYYQRAGKQFDPDLIVVNYIESDFPRAGKSGHEAHTSDEDLMIKLAAPYVVKFLRQPVPTIFTLMPLYQDLFPKPADYHLTGRLKNAVPGMELSIMRERLPWQGRQLEVRGWYNLPHDGHMSETGGTHYAAAMAKLIAEKITGRTDFQFSAQAAGKSVPARTASSVLLTPGMRERNLVANASFARWVSPDTHILDWKTRQVAEGWNMGVDGANGQGQVEASRLAADAAGLQAELPPGMSVLRFQTLRPASEGFPNIQTLIANWRPMAGRSLVVGLRLRAAPKHVGEEVLILVAANYGSGADVTLERVLFSDKFTLNTDWRHLVIPVSLPTGEGKRFGPQGSETLRLQLMATGIGKPVGFELADPVIAAVESGASDRSAGVVPAGDRKLPAAAFARLREEINARFLKTRKFSLKPYGVYRLLGREVPYGFLPLGVPYTSGFVPLTLTSDPPEQVLLNVYCTAGEVRLENPDCYHTYQVYVR